MVQGACSRNWLQMGYRQDETGLPGCAAPWAYIAARDAGSRLRPTHVTTCLWHRICLNQDVSAHGSEPGLGQRSHLHRHREGWLYLAGIKDVFTCEIVGYAMSDRMKPELPGRALFRAVQQHRPAAGTIHHSDRGSQYCAEDYQTMLEQFRFPGIDVTQRKLLRQRAYGELLGKPEDGIGSPSELRNTSRSGERYSRIHRGVL